MTPSPVRNGRGATSRMRGRIGGGVIEVRFERPASGVNAAWVKRLVRRTLRSERSKKSGVGVLFTGDAGIRRLNKKFLRHDYATDVISFGLGEEKSLGDLVVSVETARRVSRELGIGFREELARYVVHGTLHLLGYEDKKKKDRKKMFTRQEAILKKFL